MLPVVALLILFAHSPLIFYHGLSDSGPPWPYTVEYFHKVAERLGQKHPPVPHGNSGERGDSDDRLGQAGDFMKLYLVPNMGHCGGNAALRIAGGGIGAPADAVPFVQDNG